VVVAVEAEEEVEGEGEVVVEAAGSPGSA